MTLNGLLNKCRKISWLLTSGDIPLTMNGEPVEIYAKCARQMNLKSVTRERIKECFHRILRKNN